MGQTFKAKKTKNIATEKHFRGNGVFYTVVHVQNLCYFLVVVLSATDLVVGVVVGLLW